MRGTTKGDSSETAHATGMSAVAVAVQKTSCVTCGGEHVLTRCQEFKKLTVEKRVDLVFKKGLCLGCLKRGHRLRDCSNNTICGQNGCRWNHNRLLHKGETGRRAVPPAADANQTATAQGAGPEPQSARGGETRVVAATARVDRLDTGALLQVVPVTVYGKNSPYKTHALLDPGSETSFCTQNLLSKLDISGEQTKVRLRTVDGESEEKLATKVRLQVSAMNDPAKIMVPEAWSVPTLKVSRPRVSKKRREKMKHLRDLDIPDSSGEEVELLFGANVIEAVIQREVRVGQPGQPVAVRTAFGWAMTGPIGSAATH